MRCVLPMRVCALHVFKCLAPFEAHPRPRRARPARAWPACRRALVAAGGCGFIGSHVISMLVEKYPEYKFVNLDCLDRCASSKNVSAVEKARCACAHR